jgi:hypothetical protein
MHASQSRSAPVATARALFLVAMALFTVTIAIGIPNGLDVIEFDRNQLLTHVHSGTVGWLTLSIVAITFLVFNATNRSLAFSLVLCVPAYVLAFYTGSYILRAVTGTALLVIIFWLVAWTWRTYLASERNLPQLGVALAISTFTLGGVIGVLLQVQFALGISIVPGDSIGAHAGAMTFGYLALAGMAALDWKVLGTTGLPRAGVVQYVALAAGGLIITVALLTGTEQIGGMLYLVAELVAVVLFGVRVLPKALRAEWLRAGAAQFLGASAAWIVTALVLFMAVVAQFVAAGPTGTPNLGLLVASDHATYIGVVSNLTFGVLAGIVTLGGTALALTHVVFWGMNFGLAIFVVGLASNTQLLKQIGAPTMGVCLLVGLAVFALALLPVREESRADADAAGAAA